MHNNIEDGEWVTLASRWENTQVKAQKSRRIAPGTLVFILPLSRKPY